MEISSESWQLYLSSQPKATIFHHPAWSNLLSNCYGYRSFIVAVHGDGGEIKAGLPMMEISQPFSGLRWVSLPFTDHCAPLYVDQDSLRDLSGIINQAGQERGVSEMEFRWNYSPDKALSVVPCYVLHTIQLSPDFKLVQSRFHAMHRRNSVSAQKKGVRIECGNDLKDLEEFYKLHIQTRRRQGVPVQPWRFFELMWKYLIEPGLGFVMKAYQNSTCLSAVVLLKFNQTITYKYGASLQEGLYLRPNDLLFSTAIEWACENGYSRMDLGRTDFDQVGLRDFKRRWGAEEVPLAYSYRPAVPKEGGKRRLTPILQAVIRHSPLWVCRTTGEMFYRYFG